VDTGGGVGRLDVVADGVGRVAAGRDVLGRDEAIGAGSSPRPMLAPVDEVLSSSAFSRASVLRL
jgi:hypothetical protein